MAIKKISVDTFLELAKSTPVFDVRSPGEFIHASFPGAHSLPLFSDEERKIVGTLYKQQGRQRAIKAGLDYFAPKMNTMIDEVERVIRKLNNNNEGPNSIIVHCWRGGMRSAGVAWLLDLYGFQVYTLVGGYKSFRRWVLSQFDEEYDIRILGGFTGSAKTDVIHFLQQQNKHIIDLEGLASHKGSAFGALGQPPQPTQEMFENKLALILSEKRGKQLWLEDESQRIGRLNIPHALWNTMRKKPVYFLDIPFEKRLEYIVKTYGVHEREKLIEAIMRIERKLGGMEMKNAIRFLSEGDTTSCFRILLNYYDKLYLKSLANRENPDLAVTKISCEDTDPAQNGSRLPN
jgi:tRNA 2-selenouridine synthase